MRDIVANGKKVIQGDGKATIPLIASIVGGVPGAGDVAKPIVKEVGEELTEKAVKEVGTEATKKLAKEEAEGLTKFEFREVEIIDKQGNPIGEFDKIEKIYLSKRNLQKDFLRYILKQESLCKLLSNGLQNRFMKNL